MFTTILRWTPEGAAHGTLHLGSERRDCARTEIEALEANLRSQLREKAWDDASTAEAGRALWSWLDGGDAHCWLIPVLDRLAAGNAWRLDVAGDLSALSHLPWELLHDGVSFLAMRTPWFMPVRRIDDGARALAPFDEAGHDLGLLFMASAPEGEVSLAYEAEEARILDACRSDGDAHLAVEESGTLQGLGRRAAGLSPRWDVVHITCHGNDTPQELSLEDDTGALDRVTPARLKPVLSNAPPALLSLSACLTAERSERGGESFASSMAHAGMPAVLGFASKVRDDLATIFMAKLYGHLGRSEALCEALARTRYEALRADPSRDELSMAAAPGVWGAARLFLTRSVTRLAAPDDLREPRSIVRRPEPEAFLKAQGRSIKVAPPSRFVGRRRELRRLIRSLRAGKQIGAVVLGLGGAGKSSLVARALSRVELRPVVVYQQISRGVLLEALRVAYEDDPSVTALLSSDARQRAVQTDDASDFRALLRQALASDGMKRRPAVFVLDDAEAQMTPGDGAYVFNAEALATLRGVLGAVDATSGCASRVVVTGRYAFGLCDDAGRDLLTRMERIDLHRLDLVDARKLLRQADRYDDEGVERREPRSWGDHPLRARVLKVGASNARLLALLHRLMLADGARGLAALSQMEAWIERRSDSADDPAVQAYLGDLALDGLLSLAGEGGRALIAFLAGLEVPVPAEASCVATGQGDEVLRRCVDLGLAELDRDELVAVSPLVAAKVAPLDVMRMREQVRALLTALPPSWRADASGRWSGPVERAGFLFRWSADVDPPGRELGRVVAGFYLGWLQALSHAAALREETPRWERLALRWEGAVALAWAWGTTDGERAKALIDVAACEMPTSATVYEHIAVLRQQAALARTRGDLALTEQLMERAEALVPPSDQ
ncbi:MAG: CHAT domain-containing protein, partial [Polyangiales bacterium]